MAALRATGRRVYAINPMAVARYRERWTVARSKSDHADAVVLANIGQLDKPSAWDVSSAGYRRQARPAVGDTRPLALRSQGVCFPRLAGPASRERQQPPNTRVTPSGLK